MISRTHSQAHARPDEKMGRRKRWSMPGGPAWLRNPAPTTVQNMVEKRQAAKKRRQRDRELTR